MFNLICHLERAGFAVLATWDGDEYNYCRDAQAAMEFIFNLDEVSLRFVNSEGDDHGVLLVLGNGVDIVSDWNYSADDADGFNKAMDAFDAEEFA